MWLKPRVYTVFTLLSSITYYFASAHKTRKKSNIYLNWLKTKLETWFLTWNWLEYSGDWEWLVTGNLYLNENWKIQWPEVSLGNFEEYFNELKALAAKEKEDLRALPNSKATLSTTAPSACAPPLASSPHAVHSSFTPPCAVSVSHIQESRSLLEKEIMEFKERILQESSTTLQISESCNSCKSRLKQKWDNWKRKWTSPRESPIHERTGETQE